MSTSAVPAVGHAAPDFTLKDQFGQDVSLSGFRGRTNVVLVFYPFSFSGICTGELSEIRDGIQRFQSEDVQVLAVSCDHMFTQRAYAVAERYAFPVLSDFWPHGDAAKAYGVFVQDGGFATRGTFLVDREGVVRWTLVNGPGERRDFGGYHVALTELAAA